MLEKKVFDSVLRILTKYLDIITKMYNILNFSKISTILT